MVQRSKRGNQGQNVQRKSTVTGDRQRSEYRTTGGGRGGREGTQTMRGTRTTGRGQQGQQGQRGGRRYGGEEGNVGRRGGGTSEMQMNVEGLATIAEANSQVMEGLAEHLREMGNHDEAAERADECSEMCREVANELRS